MKRVWFVMFGAVLFGMGASPAEGSGGLTAPAYPGNTITVKRDNPIVAGTVVRVRLSGHAHWEGSTDDPLDSGYGLWLYVQDAGVDPACEPWFSPQLQKAINIGVNATTASSGFVMQGELEVKHEPGVQDVDWATQSTPFVVRPGVRKVMLCAYKRYIIDDVASYQMPVRVNQPRCRPRQKAVRRALRLNCNVSGRVKVIFAGRGKRRTLNARLSTKNGNGRVATRSLRPGRYRVTVRAGKLNLGKFRIRVAR